MQPNAPLASLSMGRLRRFLFFYVLLCLAVPQGVFVLHGILKFDFDPDWMLVLIPGFIPITIATLFTFGEPPERPRAEPAAWPQWALTGLAMFVIWASTYFLSGKLVDPARVRYLPAVLESHVPFSPPWSLIYVTLYPIFVLPFLLLRDRVALQRLVVAYTVMFFVCSFMFVALPVAYDRPPLPPPPHDFGTWIMTLIRGTDPPWNCLPSEHCAAAMLAALAIWEHDRKVGLYAAITAGLIGLSTLFTKQHYLVDVIAGFSLSFGIHFALRWAQSFVPTRTAVDG